MGRRVIFLLIALALAWAAAACRSSDATPVPGTPAASAPTSAAQATPIPSVTPIGASGSIAPYGSVQAAEAGQPAAQSMDAGAPLFYSAQASVNDTPAPNLTPVPLGATLVPTPTSATLPQEGVIAIPTLDDEGPIFSIINSLCIPLLNFILNATIGVAVWAWQTVGTQGGLLGQTLLCILPPVVLGWYFLFFRRRRRRRNRD
jgi:hypothetical protein